MVTKKFNHLHGALAVVATLGFCGFIVAISDFLKKNPSAEQALGTGILILFFGCILYGVYHAGATWNSPIDPVTSRSGGS